MSAYLVSKSHIDALVTLGSLHKVIPYGSRTYTTDMGKTLIRANVESIEARYPDTKGHPQEMPGCYIDAETYTHALYAKHTNLTPAAGLKAISGYEYQACEHKGWNGSVAQVFCDSLRHALIRALPGYSSADWEITD